MAQIERLGVIGQSRPLSPFAYLVASKKKRVQHKADGKRSKVTGKAKSNLLSERIENLSVKSPSRASPAPPTNASKSKAKILSSVRMPTMFLRRKSSMAAFGGTATTLENDGNDRDATRRPLDTLVDHASSSDHSEVDSQQEDATASHSLLEHPGTISSSAMTLAEREATRLTLLLCQVPSKLQTQDNVEVQIASCDISSSSTSSSSRIPSSLPEDARVKVSLSQDAEFHTTSASSIRDPEERSSCSTDSRKSETSLLDLADQLLELAASPSSLASRRIQQQKKRQATELKPMDPLQDEGCPVTHPHPSRDNPDDEMERVYEALQAMIRMYSGETSEDDYAHCTYDSPSPCIPLSSTIDSQSVGQPSTPPFDDTEAASLDACSPCLPSDISYHTSQRMDHPFDLGIRRPLCNALLQCTKGTYQARYTSLSQHETACVSDDNNLLSIPPFDQTPRLNRDTRPFGFRRMQPLQSSVAFTNQQQHQVSNDEALEESLHDMIKFYENQHFKVTKHEGDVDRPALKGEDDKDVASSANAMDKMDDYGCISPSNAVTVDVLQGGISPSTIANVDELDDVASPSITVGVDELTFNHSWDCDEPADAQCKKDGDHPGEEDIGDDNDVRSLGSSMLSKRRSARFHERESVLDESLFALCHKCDIDIESKCDPVTQTEGGNLQPLKTIGSAAEEAHSLASHSVTLSLAEVESTENHRCESGETNDDAVAKACTEMLALLGQLQEPRCRDGVQNYSDGNRGGCVEANEDWTKKKVGNSDGAYHQPIAETVDIPDDFDAFKELQALVHELKDSRSDGLIMETSGFESRVDQALAFDTALSVVDGFTGTFANMKIEIDGQEPHLDSTSEVAIAPGAALLPEEQCSSVLGVFRDADEFCASENLSEMGVELDVAMAAVVTPEKALSQSRMSEECYCSSHSSLAAMLADEAVVMTLQMSLPQQSKNAGKDFEPSSVGVNVTSAAPRPIPTIIEDELESTCLKEATCFSLEYDDQSLECVGKQKSSHALLCPETNEGYLLEASSQFLDSHFEALEESDKYSLALLLEGRLDGASHQSSDADIETSEDGEAGQSSLVLLEDMPGKKCSEQDSSELEFPEDLKKRNMTRLGLADHAVAETCCDETSTSSSTVQEQVEVNRSALLVMIGKYKELQPASEPWLAHTSESLLVAIVEGEGAVSEDYDIQAVACNEAVVVDCAQEVHLENSSEFVDDKLMPLQDRLASHEEKQPRLPRESTTSNLDDQQFPKGATDHVSTPLNLLKHVVDEACLGEIYLQSTDSGTSDEAQEEIKFFVLLDMTAKYDELHAIHEPLQEATLESWHVKIMDEEEDAVGKCDGNRFVCRKKPVDGNPSLSIDLQYSSVCVHEQPSALEENLALHGGKPQELGRDCTISGKDLQQPAQGVENQKPVHESCLEESCDQSVASGNEEALAEVSVGALLDMIAKYNEQHPSSGSRMKKGQEADGQNASAIIVACKDEAVTDHELKHYYLSEVVHNQPVALQKSIASGRESNFTSSDEDKEGASRKPEGGETVLAAANSTCNETLEFMDVTGEVRGTSSVDSARSISDQVAELEATISAYETKHMPRHKTNNRAKSDAASVANLQVDRKPHTGANDNSAEQRFLSPYGKPMKERSRLLIRELQHIQTHGPNVFQWMDEKIEAWRDHEAEWQEKLQLTRMSRPQVLPFKSFEPIDDPSFRVAHEESLTRAIGQRSPECLRSPRAANLIRELRFIQTKGGNIMKSIDDKVKSWQRQESERQLGVMESQDTHDSSHMEPTSNGETGGCNIAIERSAILGVKVKSLQGNMVPTSQHTPSTHSCSGTCTGGNEGPLLIGKHLYATNDGHPEATTTSIRDPFSSRLEAGPWRPPVVCRSMDVGERKAQVDMASVVKEVHRAPAGLSAERYHIAKADTDTMTVEVTVYSFLTSLQSDEEEWTVKDSLEDKEDVVEYDDCDDADEQETGEAYRVVGYGVSDDVSVMSDLTTPSIVNEESMESSIPASVLYSSTPMSEAKEALVLGLDHQAPFKRTLRMVPLSKKRSVRQRTLPFGQGRLKKAFTNPPRLPHMREAALLRLYRQQLKPVGIDDWSQSQHQIDDFPQWQYQPRRCFSDKPGEDGRATSNENAKTKKGLPSCVGGKSTCILDFDWDELHDMDDLSCHPHPTARSASIKPVDQPSSKACQSRPSHDDEKPPSASTDTTVLSSSPNRIRQTDSFYESVSVSFLASSIRETTVVGVLVEALRILRPGGLLNVLDMEGFVMDRIQNHPQFSYLVFQKATAKDQQRHETNTLSILEKSGVQTRFDVADPRIVHWTAMKAQSGNE
jgi:hypothetical protein